MLASNFLPFYFAITPKWRPVTDTPKDFKKWVKDHKEQIQGAKNPPYWVRNNKDVVNGIWRKKRDDTKEHPEVQNKKADEKLKEDIQKSKHKYESYNSDWGKVYFNEKTGGYNVCHKSHQFSTVKPKGANMSGGEAERHVGRILADRGKRVEFLPENGKGVGKPDLNFDESTWDVKYIPFANSNTIRKYIENAQKADNAIFYWDAENKIEDVKNAIDRTIGKYKKLGKLENIPNIYYINEKNEMIPIFKNKKIRTK